MKTYPNVKTREQKRKVTTVENPSKAIQVIALIIAFISVFYFFIQLLFL